MSDESDDDAVEVARVLSSSTALPCSLSGRREGASRRDARMVNVWLIRKGVPCCGRMSVLQRAQVTVNPAGVIACRLKCKPSPLCLKTTGSFRVRSRAWRKHQLARR